MSSNEKDLGDQQKSTVETSVYMSSVTTALTRSVPAPSKMSEPLSLKSQPSQLNLNLLQLLHLIAITFLKFDDLLNTKVFEVVDLLFRLGD